MLGFRGTWEGKPVSVQATGMGCPSAAIVIEELVMLGCKRLLRVGTCGGLQPHHALGDMIVALTAVPQDRTASTYVQRAALPDRRLGARPRRRARGEGDRASRCTSARSSRATSSTTPTAGQYQRWSERGILAVEMEAAVLFTLGALRKVHAGLPAHRQRHRRRGRVHADQRRRAARRGRPDDARRARDRHRRPLARTVFLVNPASGNGATGKRWPELAHRAAQPRPRRARRSSPSGPAI